MPKHLSVIIPAYNEENRIKVTLEAIYSYFIRQNYSWEAIIVSDGSKDKTVEVVAEFISNKPEFSLIANTKNHGKGYVVRQGMLVASGDFRLFTDADNSTSIDHLEKMLPFLSEGYDVIIASIAVKDHQVAQGSEPLWRQIFGKAGNLFIQIMAVPGIKDTQRGFKVFSTRAADDIFPRLTINRFGFDIEVLALARKFGYKIKEVGINWKNDPHSESRPRFGAYFNVLMDAVRVRWNLLTGKYNSTISKQAVVK